MPEVDTPGHASALLGLRPDLKSGRNEVEYEFLPGHRRRAVWLDPELPATFELMEQVLAGVAAIFPGPYLHIGADEPRGMPDEDYVSYVRRLRRLVRSSASNRWAGRSRRGRAWARTTSSSTGSPASTFRRPCPRRSGRRWRRRWPCRAATPRRWRRRRYR